MQAQDRRIEELHQQASASYLQGKFNEALIAWKQILAQVPDDERALEGVRLCELLAEEGAADLSVPEPPPVPAADPVPPVAEEEGFDLDLSALDMPDEPAPPAPAPSPAAAPVAAPASGPSPADAAAAELRQRVADLVVAARNAHAAGVHAEAIALLQRVSILDEDNAEAAALMATVQETTGMAVESPTDGALEIDLGGDEPPPLDPSGLPTAEPEVAEVASEIPDFEAPPIENGLPDFSDIDPTPQPDALSLAAPAAGEAVEAPEFEVPAEGGPDDPFDASVDDGELSELDGELEGEPLADPGLETETDGDKLPSLRLGRGRVTIAAIVVVVLVIGAGTAWILMGSGGDSGEDPITPEQALAELGLPTEKPKRGKPGKKPDAGGEQAATTAGEAGAEKAPTVDVEAALARGDEALAAGEFSEAIVAYNEVLSVAPNNLRARDKLEIAAEKYREQREVEQQWTRALEMFGEGDFRQALVLLYRLPAAEAGPRLERYKLNSWYNLGVQALARGDCKNAREHFAEVQAIDPRDPDGGVGVKLSRECRSRSDAYYDQVAALEPRAIDE